MKQSIKDVPQIDRTKTLLENVIAAAPDYITAIRAASLYRLELHRLDVYTKTLQLPVNEAKRLDWFVNLTHNNNPYLPAEAVALAFLAMEVWDRNDGVNDSWYAGWQGSGGGDFTIDENGRMAQVEK